MELRAWLLYLVIVSDYNRISRNMSHSLLWQLPTAFSVTVGAFLLGAIILPQRDRNYLATFASSVLLFQGLLVALPEVNLRIVELMRLGEGPEFVEEED